MSSVTRDQLESHQAALLVKIAAAAKASDTNAILAVTAELQRTASLIARFHDLGAEAKTLLGRASIGFGPERSALEKITKSPFVPGRGQGVEIRSAFLDRAARAGVHLLPFRGAIFASPVGRRIGIAVATERKPNRWFLGLSKELIDAAVLLCVPNKGKVLDICLPSSFLAKYKGQLSHSGDQVKFNVTRRDAQLILKVPRSAPVRVDGFVGAITDLDR